MDFEKIVRIGRLKDYGNVFCRITYADGRLSISGVEGPLPNGDCRGSCGQIEMHADSWDFAEIAPNWSPEMIQKFLDIWREWHMNDMRAYDAAMKKDGWHEIAKREVFGHHYKLKSELFSALLDAEKEAIAAIKSGETFTPTKEQTKLANMSLSLVIWTDSPESPDAPDGYMLDPDKSPEKRTLGWLRPSEHPDGLLGKKHPESGNKYGHDWFAEAVPFDVLQWLANLPDADVKPAWV
ncbi:hypothetical protein [uncultured Pigmentiphaga sp.]|jgi:hypothetical protein|uniref:hypothetical protein n=1 Tax=uncultured Pigmentiphaga sp. TaxID=340361 RepID=UPI002602E9BD|nr:hypothetical protein [uncultured Pigmentiphaga sp.]